MEVEVEVEVEVGSKVKGWVPYLPTSSMTGAGQSKKVSSMPTGFSSVKGTPCRPRCYM